MNTSTYANPGNCCAPESRISLAGSFSRFLAYLNRKEKQYRDLRHLNDMTDDQLKDIGLHRADIRDAVFGRSLDDIRNDDMVSR